MMIKNLRPLVFCFLMLAGLTHAEEPWKDGHPQEYLVKKGDTLWGIAELFLKDPWLWPEIWHINKQIENPHLIYPGDRVHLVYIDGKPMLTVADRADGKDDRALERVQSDGTVKLSPKTRITSLDTVIPAIPLEAVQSFLVDNRVVAQDTLDNAPYIVAGAQQRILLGAGDEFYARGDFAQEANKAYGVFRKGSAYIDPDSGEILGYQALDIGSSKIIALDDDIGTFRLTKTMQDIRIDDRLLPTIERKLQSVFHPKSPSVEIEGQIIHVFGGVRNVSQYNVVVLNRGDREELQVGDVLAVYRKGEEIRDRNTSELIRLPSERAGVLIVFRTFEKVSYGLILKADRVLKVLDEVVNP